MTVRLLSILSILIVIRVRKWPALSREYIFKKKLSIVYQMCKKKIEEKKGKKWRRKEMKGKKKWKEETRIPRLVLKRTGTTG